VQVDWKTYISAVERLHYTEKRICVFAIRMVFHDALATAKDGPDGRYMLDLTAVALIVNIYEYSSRGCSCHAGRSRADLKHC
jgi:hypothetical protein